MDADIPENGRRSRPAWFLPTLGTSALVVLVLLGAYLGTRAYLHYRHEREVQKLVARLGPELRGNGGDERIVRLLLSMKWTEADQALSRFAARSERTAYIGEPGAKGVVYFYWRREPVPGDGLRGEHISGVEQCHLGLLSPQVDWEDRLEGVGGMRLRSRDGAVEVTFSLWDDIASALGAEKGRERAALLTLDEVGQLLRGVGAPWKESDFHNGYDLRAARFLLRKAGELPTEQGEAPTP